MAIDAIGVFAGGGAKGIAHVGAYFAAIGRGIKFKYVAGTSAGSIVAALVAAGYSPQEIYNPETGKGLLEKDFIEVLGPLKWKGLSALAKGRWFALVRVWHWPVVAYSLMVLFFCKGVFDATLLEPIFNDWLLAKLDPKDETKRLVKFSDLPNLKIVGTSLLSKGAIVFCAADTPEFSVAKAIAASISIPFVFRPMKVKRPAILGIDKPVPYDVDDVIVDGGMVSNFPTWVFDGVRGRDWDISTFAFCFKSETTGEVKSWYRYIRRLLSVTISGEAILETRQVDNLFLVPIDVSVGTLDFDANTKQKSTLFSEGQECSLAAFRKLIGPQDKKFVAKLLEAHCLHLGTHLVQENGETLPHLRANIMSKGPRNTLRVAYSYNMEQDADDRLALSIGTGVCGAAMALFKPVIIDLQEDQSFSAEGWGLNKYQNAMLRKSLRTIFSIPMVDKKPTGEREVVGLLNFDSDLPLKKELHQHYQLGVEAAASILTFLYHATVDDNGECNVLV